MYSNKNKESECTKYKNLVHVKVQHGLTNIFGFLAMGMLFTHVIRA